MANVPGPQPDVKFCPTCKAPLRNIPRSQMRSRGYVRRNGVVSPIRTPTNAQTPPAVNGSRSIKTVEGE